MKIGALMQHYIPIIFEHCEKRDHSEFDRLCDRAYSKATLDVNFRKRYADPLLPFAT
jgi:hypothetical protein